MISSGAPRPECCLTQHRGTSAAVQPSSVSQVPTVIDARATNEDVSGLKATVGFMRVACGKFLFLIRMNRMTMPVVSRGIRWCCCSVNSQADPLLRPLKNLLEGMRATARVSAVALLLVACAVSALAGHHNVHRTAADRFTALWNVSTFIAPKAPVSAYSGRLFITDGIAVYTLDQVTGAQLSQSDSIFTTAPAVRDGAVVSATMGGYVGATDAFTGASLWSTPLQGFNFRARPQFGTVSGRSAVFLVSMQGTFFALNASTGARLWSCDATMASPPGTRYENANFALTPDFAYVTNGNTVFLVATATGSVQGRFSVACCGAAAVATVPTVRGSRVFVGSTYGTFFALDARTMQQLWNETTNNVTVHTQSAVSACGQVVAFGDVGGYVWAFNTSTGATLWGQQVGKSAITTSLAASRDRLFVPSTDGNLYAVRLSDGQIMGQFNALSSISKVPTVIDFVVYVAADSGTLFAVRHQ